MGFEDEPILYGYQTSALCGHSLTGGLVQLACAFAWGRYT